MARFPRRRLPPARVGKKLDHTNWQYSSGAAASIGAGSSVGLNFSSVGTQPTTLLRIRGEVMAHADGVLAPGVGAHVTYGIILVPEGSGSTVRFNLVADANAPWLLYGAGYVGYDEAVLDVVGIQQALMFRHVIDNKAMRIIRPDLEMQFVIENTTALGGITITFSYQLRWLQGF